MVHIVSNTIKGQNSPKYSNEFLSIGVGARAFAMGNAVVSSVSGVDATYWNPAALVNLDNPVNLSVMHSEYFAGLSQYDYGALAFKPDNKSALAFSLIRFGVDNIPNTLQLIDVNGNLRFDRIKSFSVADYGFFCSYSRLLPINGLSVGGNLKIINRVGGNFAKAWGFGLDISAKYNIDKWLFGVMLRDISTTFNFWWFNTTELEEVFLLTGNIIPDNSLEITLPKVILGASRIFEINKNFESLVELNADITTDGKRNVLLRTNSVSVDPHAGAELSFKKMVFLRAGINLLQYEYNFDGKKNLTSVPSIGLGFNYKKLSVNYALTDIGNVSSVGYSHIFSLCYSIVPNKNNKKF